MKGNRFQRMGNVIMGKGFRMKKGRALAAAFLLAAIMCTGCGGSYDAGAPRSSEYNSSDSVNMSTAVEGGSYDNGSSGMMPKNDVSTEGILDERKLIKTVELELETKEFEKTMTTIETQIREMGGYIETMDTYNGSAYSGSRSSRYSNMTIRIPSSKINDYMDSISGAGNMIRRSDKVDDVTLSYVDMESRRDTLRTEQSRLLEFLEKADSVETIITLEERLSEVRYQLETMESQLRTIDNLVEYSTVNVKVTEVRELTPVVKQTAWERISLGFLGSLQNIVDGIVEICIWFVINIPYLVLWAAFIGIVVWILRKRGRKRQKKNQNDTWEKDLHRREQTGPEIRQQESQIPQQESQMQQQNKEDGTN
ncbi:MAG: DUF4349 domain-containing protein [Lachnospiraceae bacterium]|nr:DUF4349 domain-containing protein [Lachnospiraceae bacterium]